MIPTETGRLFILLVFCLHNASSISLTHTFQLQLAGRNLPWQLMDTIDPYIKVYETSLIDNSSKLIGTTEVVSNNPNPDFITPIVFIWKPNIKQHLTFQLRDSDVIRDNTLDEVGIDANELVAKGLTANLTLRPHGYILIKEKKGDLYVKVTATYRLSSSVPFSETKLLLEAHIRNVANGTEALLYSTSAIKSNFGFTWIATIPIQGYQEGAGQIFILRIVDSSTKVIGSASLSLDDIVRKGGSFTFDKYAGFQVSTLFKQ